MRTYRFGILGTILALTASLACAQPFTYQGMLKQNGAPVNATLSMTFKLYDALTGGNQVGSSITQNVAVQNGLFTVQLDFGTVWTGSDRYLEIAVGSTVLSPRVRITAAPYASYASYAGRPWVRSGSSIFYTDGNVGIGTSSPSVRLSLGNDNAHTKLAIWDGGSLGVLGLGVGASQFRLHLANSSNRFSFLDAPNGNEIMTILGSGNVGIGTSNPSERLHVNGNIRLANDGSIFGLDMLVGSNDLKLYGDATGGPDLHIAANGNVGIGRIIPQARLHVSGTAFFTQGNTTLQVLPNQLFDQMASNTATLEIPGNGTIGIWDSLSVQGGLHVGGSPFTLGGGTDPFWRRVEAGLVPAYSGLYVGYFVLLGANGNKNILLSYRAGYPDHGAVVVYDANGTAQAGMYVADNGYGVVWGDSKLFRVPDPDDATRDIWYGCIEGPELAMYVRGTARLVNGRARIELPDHFRKLADEQGMTVQLTPLSPESEGLCVLHKGLDGIEVAELRNGRGNYEFDWRVEAVRKEHRDFRVYRPWDEVLLGGTDPAQAWEARLKSIQDRQARQQAKEAKR
ncbi:hypothetical protein HRbin15_00518 [bacterium HR15]|nr:hypothetical protein HRbin15_00518 [bacterium HR15]